MSKKILLLTDSNTTMSNETAKKYGVEILPLGIFRNDDKSFTNELNTMGPEKFLEMAEQGYSFKTSCTPQLVMEDIIVSKLKEYDYILALPISSKWSSQYDHLKVMSQDPKFNRLYVADVLDFGFANENLCIELRKMIDNGTEDMNTLVSFAESYNLKSACYFACYSLKGLVASGRIPSVISKIFKLTKTYPIIKVEHKNHLGKIVKNWEKVPKAMFSLLSKAFGELRPEDIKAICVLKVGNSEAYLNNFVSDLASFLKIDKKLIEIKWTPNIFLNIVGKDGIGIHVIANRNKTN